MPRASEEDLVRCWFRETRHGFVNASVHGALPELSIAEMAEAYGVTMRTLRFYEEKGLLRPRRVGNRRLYRDHDQRRMVIISKGKSLGLPIEEIRELVALMESDKPESERLRGVAMLCQRQSDVLRKQYDELSAQIAETKRLYDFLGVIDGELEAQERQSANA